MPEIKNTQTAQKNSKGAAQNSTRKVNIIEIDLTASNNKVESFKKRVKASANNIDRFPEAEILVKYKTTASIDRERNVVEKYSLLDDGSQLVIMEGDKRKRESCGWKRNLGDYKRAKSNWILKHAEKTLVVMSYYSAQRQHNYSEDLGFSKDLYDELFNAVFPERAKADSLQNAISMATAEVMNRLKMTMVEGTQVDDYRILRANDWGVSIEYEDHRLDSVAWENIDFFLPFKKGLDGVFKQHSGGYSYSSASISLLGKTVDVSLVLTDEDNKVKLAAGSMEEIFDDGDFLSMYNWMLDNRHNIIKPKYSIFSYAGLYGTNMVEDVVSIAKDVLQVNYQYVRDDVNYEVVYRNEIGVTFTAASTEVINGTPFNNYWLVSRNWADFQGWNNMPPEDMCSVDLEWKVEDGVATLINETSEDNNYSKAI